MTHSKAAALAAAGLIALAGCQHGTDTAAFDKQAKDDVRKFIPAFNTGDVETLIAMYAPDAEVMAPGNPRAVGHDAIRATLTKESAAMQAAGITLALNDDDKTGASGDLGYHSGSFTVKDASGAVIDSGNYLAVMKNTDGKWLIIRDTWNSDRPPPAPAAPAEAAPADPAAPPPG